MLYYKCSYEKAESDFAPKNPIIKFRLKNQFRRLVIRSFTHNYAFLYPTHKCKLFYSQ